MVAVIVARDPDFADGAAVLAGVASQLARFKQPRVAIFVAELPKNSMGKVQTTVLREQYQDSFAAVPSEPGRGLS